MTQMVLVTGANGFVGRALCEELACRMNAVRCAVRVAQCVEGLPGEAFIVGDIDGDTDWSAALDGVDVVIHLAARVHVMREVAIDPMKVFHKVNVAGTERLARAAAERGVRRIVFISSIGVNGNHTIDKPFTEENTPAPYNPYTASKLEAERVLFAIAAEKGIEVAVIRPPLVYGPDNPGNFLRLLRLLALGIPLPLAAVKNQRSMIYIGNLVDALITCATHPRAAGKVFLVSDGVAVSTPQLIHELASLMGNSSRLWSFPPALLRLAGWLSGKSGDVERLLGSLEIDSSRIRQDLAWSPPFTMEQGLAETVCWFRSEGCETEDVCT